MFVCHEETGIQPTALFCFLSFAKVHCPAVARVGCICVDENVM